MPHRTTEGIVADLAASVSGAGAAISWIATVNDVLQVGATAIAIVAGVYAVRWHRIRIKLAKEKLDAKVKSERRPPK